MATLVDIEKISQNIKNSKLKAVQALHVAAYGEEGRPRLTKRDLKKFPRFKLDRESSEYQAKVGEIKNNLNSSDLTAICHILNLDYAGQREDILDRVCTFLNDLSVSDDIIDEQEDVETEDEAVEDRRYTDESESKDRTDEEDSPRLQSSAGTKA
ncbi:protein DEK-like [Euwallacea similis]|uniref:protein DEK-like n=1 Tax=Euwallacea similis TaxID=1736056 RepID=UPI0034501B48